MSNDLISVIVPVYNVEEYLDECIKSITEQTYKNIEIILVDDGSTDNSGSICDKWQSRDNRIRVIHRDNGGASSARNSGIKIAVGRYIAYVDSDDWIRQDMYEVMHKMIVTSQADVAICREMAVDENDKREMHLEDIHNDPTDTEKNYIENRLQVLNHFTDDFTGVISWSVNKLYKRELVTDISFPEYKYIEDLYYNANVLRNINNAVRTDKRLYYYRQRKNSAMKAAGYDAYVDWSRVLIDVAGLFDKTGDYNLKKKFKIYALNKMALMETEAYYKGMDKASQKIRMEYIKFFSHSKKDIGHGLNIQKIYLARYFRRLYHILKKRQVKRNPSM